MSCHIETSQLNGPGSVTPCHVPPPIVPNCPNSSSLGGALIYRALQFLLEALAPTCKRVWTISSTLFNNFLHYFVSRFVCFLLLFSYCCHRFLLMVRHSDHFTNLSRSHKIKGTLYLYSLFFIQTDQACQACTWWNKDEIAGVLTSRGTSLLLLLLNLSHALVVTGSLKR